MGGLKPRRAAALWKASPTERGKAWGKVRLGGTGTCKASAAEEQTMQEAQVGQLSSAAASESSAGAAAASVIAACSSQSAWCAGATCGAAV